jgi:uncharacterized membrane protein YgcG
MAVTAIHHRARRERPSALRRLSLLLLVVAWAAIFAAAYALGTRSHARTAASSTTLAPGANVSSTRAAPVRRSPVRRTHRLTIRGLTALPTPPTMKPRARPSVAAVAREPVYYAPVYRAPARPSTPSSTSTTTSTPTGGGPHGSGGGGGTTTVGSGAGSSGGGGLGTGTTSTGTTTPAPPPPTGTTSTGTSTTPAG